MNLQNFSYTDLSIVGASPRSFDGMAAGRFIDMWGRETVFLPEELPAYVANTKLALSSTADSNGQVVGFPIDGMNHNNGLAAGWIVDVNLSDGRDVIEFTPRWNDIGASTIGADSLRFFSPTVDTDARVIIGGSLTNWPATRTSNHQILLRPVELSAQMQTYDTAPIVTLGDMLKNMIAELKTLVTGLVARPADQPPEQAAINGVETMEDNLIVTTTQTPEAVAELANSPVTPDPAPEPEPVVELAIAAPVVDLAAPAALALIEARATELASERAALIVAEREHESELVSFAARMVGGDTEHPRGLTVGHDRLTAFLRALPVSLYPEAVAILSDAAEHSPVEYSEAGHSRVLHGVRQLPDVIKPALQSWIKAGLSLESFFETNSVELGNMTDYNLSEYQGE